ncbi:MAG: VTT domain-containing protein [Cyanobacteriota bacterium]
MPAFVLIYLLATILGLPNILLILIAGTLFDLVIGVILVSIADTLGAIACFLIGRTVARKPIKRWMRKHQNLAQLDRAIGHKGWKILLLTRLSPLLPSNVLNYGFSCTKVNFWQYCFFSWLGMLPVIILYVYLAQFGTFVFSDKLTPSKLALQTLGFLITIGTALYTTRLARKALSGDDPLEKSTQKSPKG